MTVDGMKFCFNVDKHELKCVFECDDHKIECGLKDGGQ